jgi:hypothetical protein
MYKAVFYHSPTRTVSFVTPEPADPGGRSRLSKPRLPIWSPFDAAPADEKAYTANLALIRKTIVEDFQYPLTASDVGRLEYVYKTFRTEVLRSHSA